ncbi:bifunctional sugar phosphate isomerase/epimerase/4-hydroxyphenylpyruvate dioxygenase family protein [Nonomuraea sp. NEAU-A123]|uniref:bifunctional sugar phosphate isomerase/epimerase/4-hydroxyphenylpyruvate dioxygenase family protein n=1 Tax=Nonomuraea sp. NEAU-A123 TaxID=2839649 RepID=UPI001BE46517|nr:sugar phosphate isomerase/epimerase and 4-hydroxyphenylpyruvate domain-containing protein [Nonomuraea sp. NEAU-A123]MBT2225544.1 sugar phosphate isomerase/epimerase and 4-hydroxyphenylpyruvate domain-containing protein [Nonomuraea sp. NEAU-A123]
MRKSIATVSVSGTLAEKLTAISAAGFDGVEIFENDLLVSPLSPEEVRARARDLGLGIDLYQPFRDFEAVPGDVLAGNLRRAERKFEVMERLGATLLLVCSSVSPDAIDDDELAAEQLRLLAERAAGHGISIAYEALAWGRHVNEYLHAWRIVRMADHPNLGTCLDSFHILSRGSDPIGIEAIPGDKVFFLQLADAPLLAMDVLQWSRHYRCFPGQGTFDLAGLVTHVLETGYAGPLSLEVFNDGFRQADAGRTSLDAMRSLIALEEAAARRRGTTPPIPPPVIPSGFAFAELSVPPAVPSAIASAVSAGDPPGPPDPPGLPRHPPELSALLAALGFVRTGTHPGKPVELWEQGEARILLNATGDEPALAAIGLESPDPAGSVKRAESLLSPVLPRHRAPREARLDAIAAPDGTELFFCRTEHPGHSSWTDDFRPRAEGTARAPAAEGITHIDHVALTQPRHHFDEAALFYRGVLGLRPQESLEVPDPYGLLRSKAMSSEDGALRMVLNINQVGAQHIPWQHIALACDDIVATAHRLRAAHPGLLLPVPANYYDDLAARYDAPPELRELGLLYDRDEHGEFLHLYTITAGRVFFEIVQRVGDYQGYGAANAPVRLAAQHAWGGQRSSTMNVTPSA